MNDRYVLHIMSKERHLALVTVRVPWRLGDIRWTTQDEITCKTIRLWLERATGDPLPYAVPGREPSPVPPDDPRYPKAVARMITIRSPFGRGSWAYVTAPDIWVTLSQIARAAGTKMEAARSIVEQAGVPPVSDGNRQVYSMIRLAKAMPEIADGIVLRPGQVAAFLGVSRNTARRVLLRLNRTQGLPIQPVADEVRVRWQHLRRVRRISPQRYRFVRVTGGE